MYYTVFHTKNSKVHEDYGHIVKKKETNFADMVPLK